MIQLRPYQIECVEKIKESFLEFNRVLVVLSVAAGKTIIFNEVAKSFIKNKGRVLVLAHREELLSQAAEKMSLFNDIEYTVIKSGFETDMDKYYYVGSVQSLYRPKRLKKFPRDYFSLIITDESHHLTCDTYQAILKYFKNYKLLGVTATERKSEAKKFASMFDTKAYEYSIQQMISDGFGSRVIARNANISVDLSGVSIVNGDFSVRELDQEITKQFDKVGNYIINNLHSRKSIIIFTPRVESAFGLAERLRYLGLASEAVCGATKERADIIRRFKNGEIRVLINALVFSEGTDIPNIDCIFNLRPTLSEIFYTQVIGRGLRLFPNKENCLIVDCLWGTDRDILHPANIFSKEESVCHLMKDFLITNVNKSYDILNLEKLMDFTCHYKEMESARRLTCSSLSKKGLKDYRIFAFIIDESSILKYEPVYEWEVQKITQKQEELLVRNGISPFGLTKGLASKLIDVIIKRIEKKLATPKQMFFMASKGIVNKVHEIQFMEAKDIMDSAVKNYFRIPNRYFIKWGSDERLKTPLVSIRELDIKPIEEGEKTWAQQI